MSVADTSFLVAFFDADDARHKRVRQEFAAVDPVVIGAEALVETLGVLKVKGGRRTSDQALEDLMGQPNVEWAAEADPVATYRLYTEHSGISFVDAAVVQAALRRKTTLLTLDGRQVAVHAKLAKG